MKDLGHYEIRNFSKIRQVLGELYEVSTKKTAIVGLIELNIHKARQLMKDYENKTNTLQDG